MSDNPKVTHIIRMRSKLDQSNVTDFDLDLWDVIIFAVDKQWKPVAVPQNEYLSALLVPMDSPP